MSQLDRMAKLEVVLIRLGQIAIPTHLHIRETMTDITEILKDYKDEAEREKFNHLSFDEKVMLRRKERLKQ